ncbi:hypothetical protein Naga_100348g6, partial [Nannochloropsis gaditana]
MAEAEETRLEAVLGLSVEGDEGENSQDKHHTREVEDALIFGVGASPVSDVCGSHSLLSEAALKHVVPSPPSSNYLLRDGDNTFLSVAPADPHVLPSARSLPTLSSTSSLVVSPSPVDPYPLPGAPEDYAGLFPGPTDPHHPPDIQISPPLVFHPPATRSGEGGHGVGRGGWRGGGQGRATACMDTVPGGGMGWTGLVKPTGEGTMVGDVEGRKPTAGRVPASWEKSRGARKGEEEGGPVGGTGSVEAAEGTAGEITAPCVQPKKHAPLGQWVTPPQPQYSIFKNPLRDVDAAGRSGRTGARTGQGLGRGGSGVGEREGGRSAKAGGGDEADGGEKSDDGEGGGEGSGGGGGGGGAGKGKSEGQGKNLGGRMRTFRALLPKTPRMGWGMGRRKGETEMPPPSRPPSRP